MLMTEKRSKRQSKEMTPFGRTLNKLMVDHDVYDWKQLRELLRENGYKIGQSRLSQYLYGVRDPQDFQDFFYHLSKVLSLDEEEMKRLSYAYACSPKVREEPKPEHRERAELAEEEMHRRVEEGEDDDEATDR